MKMMSSWIILYACLLFGTEILCDENYDAALSFSVNRDHKFFCSNGSYIKWSRVCDGHNDCSDSSDETKELCAIYEYGTNTTMDCGRVNISKIEKRQSQSLAPWTVGIREKLNYMGPILCFGSIITPNIVISVAHPFRYEERQTFMEGDEYEVEIREMILENEENQKNQKKKLNVAMIYFTRNRGSWFDLDNEDLSVLVLANTISFGNSLAPVCIDWYSKYDMRNEAQLKIIGIEDKDKVKMKNSPIFRIDDMYEVDSISFKARQGFIPYIDNSTCLNTHQMICMRLEQDLEDMLSGAGISIFHSNTYFLTGVIPTNHRYYHNIGTNILGLTSIKKYVGWIRQIVNKYATMHACVLPSEEGVIYTYKYSYTILSHGTLIYSNLNVTEDCEDGYHKAYSYSFRICQGRGKWFSSSEKLCFKNCPPLLSKSLDIKYCTLNGEYANCSNPSIHNKIVTASCKSPYTSGAEQEGKPFISICQSNGEWDKQLHECYQLEVCVLPNSEGVLYTYRHSDRSTYGKFVNYSLTVRDYCSFGYNDALTNINIKYEDCPGGNWQTISNKTLCLRLCPPLLSDSLNIKCSYNDKYANCSNLSIPGTIATPSCKPTYVLPSGQIETPIELHCQSNGTWDKQLLYRCYPSSSCVLPTVEGAVYTYENSNESLSHGTFINHSFTVYENCAFGYHHNIYSNSFLVCMNGKWIKSSDIFCFKMCPPLLSDSLDIKCSFNGYDVDCSKLSKPDTKAIPSCKPTFTLSNGQIEPSIELHCLSNGTWNNKLYTCDQVCGRPFFQPQILIKKGETANVGTAPWNVAIYKNTSYYYDFQCGGSIISRNLVISAAHCFWENNMPYNITIFDGLYKIAAGKYYKNFTIYENEYPLIMNVDIIYLNTNYLGVYRYYAEDIAVVVLQDSVSFNNVIAPICIDWDGNYDVPNGAEGQIVGWGKTENDIESTILLKIHLPYFNRTTCQKMYGWEFRSYVTYDKFCAGSTLVSGLGVDRGDSGAGLCFSHSNYYYLTGVVSLKFAHANDSIAVFTAVQSHIKWIRELYDRYKKVQYN